MARKAGATRVFDPEQFGAALRKERYSAGYSGTAALSSAIEEKTGVVINSDTLFKYERGERTPDYSKILAIAITLYGKKWPAGLVDLSRSSFPNVPAPTDTSLCVGQVEALATVIASHAEEVMRDLELTLLRRIVITAQAKGQLTPSPALEEWKELSDLQSEAFFSRFFADQTRPTPADSGGLDTSTSADGQKGGTA